MKKTKSPWPARMKEVFPSLKHDNISQRKMMIAGLDFIDAEGKADRRFESHEQLSALVAADHTALEMLLSTMRTAAPGQTPAAVRSCLAEILLIKKYGWESYRDNRSDPLPL